METKWKISHPFCQAQGESPVSTMREIPQIEISPNKLVFKPTDPFACSISRHSQIPFHFGRLKPVKKIDKACSWLWGTNPTRKTGVGRYRSKNGQAPFQAPQSSHQPHKQLKEADEMMEELLYTNEAGSAHGRLNLQRILAVLESITALSRFSSLGSLVGNTGESDGNPTTQEKASTPPPTTTSNQTAPASVRRESARRRMPIDRLGFLSTQNGTRRAPVDSVEDIFNNPVGSDVEERGDEDEPIEETQVVKTKSKGPVRTKGQLPALSDISLPKLPGFIWGNNSSVKVAKTKRTLDQNVQVQINSCRSECHAAPRATLQPSPPMCTSGLNSAGKNGGRMQEKKENLTKSTSSTTPLKTQRSPRNIHIRVCSSSRSRLVRVNGLSRLRSKHLSPGGYIGQSPTKKLPRKECTAP
ncbi:hypothetical protein MJO28_013115 [Puccinia striiformis f. sp. tritici]|uniref:Uncharacterized protein n=1 Tax=Puccinia striiformis f. sp. tritici TaxID=168172 RepID=A0ACC0DXW2_9BASI|nr:hypothetical protein MJO28_013115 [Puccinia striiformis f. sp. tritici]